MKTCMAKKEFLMSIIFTYKLTAAMTAEKSAPLVVKQLPKLPRPENTSLTRSLGLYRVLYF